jgi:hypothetical protein
MKETDVQVVGRAKLRPAIKNLESLNDQIKGQHPIKRTGQEIAAHRKRININLSSRAIFRIQEVKSDPAFQGKQDIKVKFCFSLPICKV